MKKIVSLLIALVVVLAAFSACGGEKAPVEKDYNLAIGVVITENLASSKLTETVAAVVTDADGKIVLCRLDCVDYAVKYDDDDALITTAPTSKVAQGEAYDAYSPLPAGSWYEQGAALEKYVLGKTQAEVAAIALEGGKATDADLVAVCSIAITDLLKAIDNAFNSEHKIAFKTSAEALTAGLSVLSAVKDTASDETKAAKLTVDYAATVLAEGKVVATILDTAEAELKDITEEGAASVSYNGTKREQGEAYDAYSPMPAGTWYVQADAYAVAAVGKTADDIATLASEGVAGCTIYAGGYKAAIEAAVVSAR